MIGRGFFTLLRRKLSLRFLHLPRGLFGRTFLIIVLPTLITLSLATYVFFKRHWVTVTYRMTYAVAGDVAVMVDLLHAARDTAKISQLSELAREKMDLEVSFTPTKRAKQSKIILYSPLHDIFSDALRDRLKYPFTVAFKSDPDEAIISVQLPEGLYVFSSPMRRIYSPTTEVFILWMAGSSFLLSLIAVLFMRNQVRPIRRLADAAEAIGKGQDVPWFKLEGAREVRQAGAALMVMRDRLVRQMTQRTAMLAGISHDLRTPLTRMQLQLAMMPDSQDKEELLYDVQEMQKMVEAYLAFARGEEGEVTVETDMPDLLNEIVAAMVRQGDDVALVRADPIHLAVRRDAMKRCLTNLIGNAVRYGTVAKLTLVDLPQGIEIWVDDNGPGIPPQQREEVFRPFARLEESRNQATGGVGLGLTIALDVARAHGGDILLEESPLGGTRARVLLPK